MDLIKKGKLSDIIFKDLEKRIKGKEYEVGEKLPSENELSKFYKVSRVPVREALSRLVSMGYVESSQGRGSYVKTTSVADQVKAYTYESFNKKELLDLLEMRTVLEVQSAPLSALRRTEEDLKEIAAALKHFKKITTNQHVIGMEADYDFHKAIVISTKNEYMIQTFNNLQTVHRDALEFSLKLNIGKPEKRESVYEEHELIYEAIKNQSPEQAAKYMETHLFNMRRKLGDDRI